MSRSPRSAGFTLIEILVVVTIIGALLALAVPIIQTGLDKAHVTACASNLSQIGKNMMLWVQRNRGERWPQESGIRFLLLLHRDGMITGKNSTVFLCPGQDDRNWTDEDPDEGSAYADWDDLDPVTISYAGRDAKNFPINKNKMDDEVIAADDNDGRGNHRFSTNYLYADGTVRTFDAKIEVRERDIDLGDLDYLVVGPDSPFEPLKKLLID
ncbi:MAG: type II secretion system protein [Planctomycetes bacterium]|nr:type II secretion system protein [Planctomycetota bacterium]